MPDIHAIEIHTTTDSVDHAKQLAKGLSDNNLAACCTLFGPGTSMYTWEGDFCCDEEWVLTIKTTRDRFKAVEAFITSNHHYDVPQIIFFDIAGGSQAYLDWLSNS